MPRSLIAPFAFAVTLLAAVQAHATDVKITGHANGYQTVNIQLSGANAPLSLRTEAGGFATTVNGESFLTFCVDLYEWTSFGTLYTDYSLVPEATHRFANARANTDIAKLFTTAGTLTNSVQQAAFQIAVWEIAYEAAGAYNRGTGAAVFSGGTARTSGALNLATTWLNALPGQTRQANLIVLESAAVGRVAGHQDLVAAAPVTVSAVPEPSTYALLATGLMGIGFMSRRRARASV